MKLMLIDFLQSREGRTWTAADTAEVRRVILQIESVAEAIVQRHMQATADLREVAR